MGQEKRDRDRNGTGSFCIYLHTVLYYADCGMEIGLAVVVRELSETGNAFKHGVRVGDEIHQVSTLQMCELMLLIMF